MISVDTLPEALHRPEVPLLDNQEYNLLDVVDLPEDTLHQIQGDIAAQGGRLFVAIHPLWNSYPSQIDRRLPDNPRILWWNDVTQALASQNQERVIRIITNADRNIFYRPELNITYNKYLTELVRTVQRQKLLVLAEVEEKRQMTIRIFRGLGYNGMIVYYDTYASRPSPAEPRSQGFTGVTDNLILLESSSLVVGGSNIIWRTYDDSPKAYRQRVSGKPMVISDSDEAYSVMNDCVFGFIRGVSIRFDEWRKFADDIILPEIILSPVSWPQPYPNMPRP